MSIHISKVIKRHFSKIVERQCLDLVEYYLCLSDVFHFSNIYIEGAGTKNVF